MEREIRDLKRKIGGWEKEEENHWRREKRARVDRERKEQFQREVRERVRIEEIECDRVWREIQEMQAEVDTSEQH